MYNKNNMLNVKLSGTMRANSPTGS